MAKAEVKTRKQIQIRIDLNEREARWLKGFMQNPIRDENESEEAESVRVAIFNALTSI